MVGYMLLASAVLFYLSMAHVTYKFTMKIRKAWFGENRQDTPDALLALGWPVTLPFFYSTHYDKIRAVKVGMDWADINVPPERRAEYKNKYMRKTI
jgi:hypothetical protein